MKTQGIMRICFGLVVLTALVIAAGCDGQKGGKTERSQKQGVKKINFNPENPCALMEKEEVEALMKQKVNDPESQDGFCMFYSEKPRFTSFEITVTTPSDPSEDLKDLMKSMKEEGPKLGHVIKQVSGIGDDAFFQLVPQENEKYLYVAQGRYFFVFRARGDKGNDLSEDAVKTLVKTALDRI